MDEYLLIIYADDIVKILALVWLSIMLVVGVYEFRNAKRKKRILERLEAEMDGIEVLLGKPWKEARRLLKSQEDVK